MFDSLFSGLGTAAFKAIWKLLSSIWSKSRVKAERRKAEGNGVEPLPSAFQGQISHRLRTLLLLVNQARLDPPVSPSRIAERFGSESAAELDSYFDGGAVPSFVLLDKIADLFGANQDWLKHGNDTPFDSQFSPIAALNALPFIEALNPVAIFLVRASSRIGPGTFVIQVNKWKFLTPKCYWHISDIVGGTGAFQLESFYHFILDLQQRRPHLTLLGCTAEEQDIGALAQGTLYPGVVTRWRRSDWWDDLVDLDHKYSSPELCRTSYGDSFIAAQEIIRGRLISSEHQMKEYKKWSIYKYSNLAPLVQCL